jgi:hypothetical protein
MNPIQAGITLRPAVGRLKQVIYGFIFAISLWVIGAGDSCAAMAVLNNGQEIDISVEHLQRIKDSPGIFFFTYPPEKIFKHKIKDWVVIKLSDELGGGFLAGTPENMTQALAQVNTNEDMSKPSPIKPTTLQQSHRNENPPWVEFEISYGCRQDQLDWNIAGNLQGENPNILSDLTWEDLLIHEMRLGIRTTLNRPIYFRGSLHYGVIVDGANQDSDYAADDREMEFSRSNNNADEGSTFDASLGIGYNFRVFSERLNIIPQAGYSIHRQNLTITDGDQTITWAGGPPLGSFDGLDSTYETQWLGPWIGMNLAVKVIKSMKYPPPFSICLYYEYHWAEYYAEADWNLREDFEHPKSFEHEADGTGRLMGVAFRVRISDGWSLTAGYESETWSAEAGIDRVFLANGTTISTRLNEVNWESETYQLGFTFRF